MAAEISRPDRAEYVVVLFFASLGNLAAYRNADGVVYAPFGTRAILGPALALAGIAVVTVVAVGVAGIVAV
ncbi:MAG: hypothetical protein JRJ87_21110 [Deltaproteobacteria bacterium]|nr:hypothetical protein [Deltaproteobacteria bacterium]